MALFFIVVAHSGFLVLSFVLCFSVFIWKLLEYKQGILLASFTFTLQCLSVSAKTFFTVPPEFTRPAVKGHPGHSFLSPSVPPVNSPNATFVISHGKDSLFVSSASGPSSPLQSVLFSLSERGNSEKHRPINRCAQSLWTRKMLSLLEALIWRTIEAYRKMRRENWHLSGA